MQRYRLWSHCIADTPGGCSCVTTCPRPSSLPAVCDAARVTQLSGFWISLRNPLVSDARIRGSVSKQSEWATLRTAPC